MEHYRHLNQENNLLHPQFAQCYYYLTESSIIKILPEESLVGNVPEKCQATKSYCPACKSVRAMELLADLVDVEDRTSGSYTVSRCLDCGFVFLSLRPDSKFLPLCYGKRYHARVNSQRSVVSQFLYGFRTRIRLRCLLSACDASPMSVLEIGCGDASLLLLLESELQKQARLVGVELDAEGISLPPCSGVELVSGSFETAHIAGSFDLAIMYGVLEHVEDPVEALRQIHSLLRPGGLLVGQVPRWGCFWQRVFPRHWAGLQIPRHLSFFEPDSLRRTLTEAGFKAGSFSEVFDPGDLSVSLVNWITDSLRLRTLPREAWFFLPLTVVCSLISGFQRFVLKSSGSMAFVAKKPEKASARISA